MTVSCVEYFWVVATVALFVLLDIKVQCLVTETKVIRV